MKTEVSAVPRTEYYIRREGRPLSGGTEPHMWAEGSAHSKKTAHLWAASWEMLEMLEDALSTIRTHAMQTHSKVSAEQAERIEKLIAKARGES